MSRVFCALYWRQPARLFSIFFLLLAVLAFPFCSKTLAADLISHMVSICNRVWELMPHKVHGHSFTHVSRYHKIWKDGKQTVPAKETSCKEEVNDISGLNKALKYFDENFFNDSRVQEMMNGAKEFNIPVFRENRAMVASDDGGLHDPSVLVFNSSWGSNEAPKNIEKFNYPSLSGVQRPVKEDDIAFMTVLELGELIRTKKITSLELTNIFLQRLKRYNHVLEAVITYTEELAHTQAKEADKLLAQGVYLDATRMLYSEMVSAAREKVIADRVCLTSER